MRSLQPEILDRLDVGDPRAIQSRRDLQKVNALMGHSRFLARALRGSIAGSLLVELGSGDGTLLLKVARRLGTQTQTRPSRVRRSAAVGQLTRLARRFKAAGWEVERQGVRRVRLAETPRSRAVRCDHRELVSSPLRRPRAVRASRACVTPDERDSSHVSRCRSTLPLSGVSLLRPSRLQWRDPARWTHQRACGVSRPRAVKAVAARPGVAPPRMAQRTVYPRICRGSCRMTSSFGIPPPLGVDLEPSHIDPAMAMTQLAAVGADLFLAGHLHVSHVGHTAERLQDCGTFRACRPGGHALHARPG